MPRPTPPGGNRPQMQPSNLCRPGDDFACAGRRPDTGHRLGGRTAEGETMSKVPAGITISVDGFITGPGVDYRVKK